jgi:hypothetical protein
VLLSGDVHFAELSCVDANLNSPLLELTSSGLNLAMGEVGEYKFLPAVFGYISRLLFSFLPGRYQLDNLELQENLTQVHGSNYFSRVNFGSVKIDWDQQTVDLAVHSAYDGTVAFNHTVSFNKSKFHGNTEESFVQCVKKSDVLDRVSAFSAK